MFYVRGLYCLWIICNKLMIYCEHMVDICPCASSCDERLPGDDKASIEFETNLSVSVCTTCLLAVLVCRCGAQRRSTGM